VNITLQQLTTLDAVITHGSFQAGANSLNKTHPSVIAALRKLEDELGFALFNRNGYRTILTEQGKLFHDRAKRLLGELDELKEQSIHIRKGEAAELNIILGDVTPIADALKILRQFSEQHASARLNLFFENLSGPNERLLAGEVDVIIHHIDKSDPRYEYKDLCQVPIIPVVAPGFLDVSITRDLRYSDLRCYTQCIIRDTASSESGKNYFILPDAPHITVGDQYTKKEVIMQRMGWGHMPLFLIQRELDTRKLISIEGDQIKGATVEIVVARRRMQEHGDMVQRLWQAF
jgi:DNA-binding transcriptional LysR family regulator